MKSILLFLLFSGIAPAQLTPATGDDFTIAVYNDTHVARSFSDWTNAVDWLVGSNGRGPNGQPAIAYWNIKAVAGAGDYVSPGGDDCNALNWATAVSSFQRIFNLGLPGVWPQGNHDYCAQYTNLFGGLPGVTYGDSVTLQASTWNVSTNSGMVRLGMIGAGTADDMALGQPSRIWADGVLSSSEPDRQWIFIRHVGTYAPYGNPGPYVYPAVKPEHNDDGWCADGAQCAGFSGTNFGTALRDNFYAKESKVFWGVHGHNGYVAMNSLKANDGHVVNVTGNLGASGGTPGWITLLKFRPSHNDIQVAVYLSYDGPSGSLYAGPYTWAWTRHSSLHSTPGHPANPKKRGRL